MTFEFAPAASNCNCNCNCRGVGFRFRNRVRARRTIDDSMHVHKKTPHMVLYESKIKGGPKKRDVCDRLGGKDHTKGLHQDQLAGSGQLTKRNAQNHQSVDDTFRSAAGSKYDTQLMRGTREILEAGLPTLYIFVSMAI